MRAYLDHAATSPLRPEARAAMDAVRDAELGNPSALHGPGRHAAGILDEAREGIAAALGAEPGEVVLTSGGTESDNLAIQGAVRAWVSGSAATQGPTRRGRRGAVVCSAIEHHAVLDTCRELCASAGVELRLAPVGRDGVLNPEALVGVLDEDVLLVSAIAVNNEVGTVQPLGAIRDAVRRHAPRALLHTDAVQAPAWRDVAGIAAGFDLVSVAAHKVGGPVGAGALVVRRGVRIAPLVHGGGQERGRRSGTPGVVGAAGFAAALLAAAAFRGEGTARVASMRDRLEDALAGGHGDRVHVTVPRERRVEGICHVLVEGVANEELLWLLDEAGVSASGGSACASGATEPSHVLCAIGIAPSLARGALRLSLGWSTTAGDVDAAIEAMSSALGRLGADRPAEGEVGANRHAGAAAALHGERP